MNINYGESLASYMVSCGVTFVQLGAGATVKYKVILPSMEYTYLLVILVIVLGSVPGSPWMAAHCDGPAATTFLSMQGICSSDHV